MDSVGYVELNRSFAVIGKDQEPDLESRRFWGRKLAGWLGWHELLTRWRVVLLAEAASGKTWEFRHQAASLSAQGRAAFCVTMEDLADEGLEVALDPSAVGVLARWRESGAESEAWLFLDSVDEARLHGKSLERALRHLVRDLGPGLQRAHVFLSCRVSDWKGQEDRNTIERLLPVCTEKPPTAPVTRDAALLAPIIEGGRHKPRSGQGEGDEMPGRATLVVVQLVPLDHGQLRTLAAAWRVADPDEFSARIAEGGLTALADRPGDLLDLAAYWGAKGRFGSLVEMTEHAVNAKLSEYDKHRPDNRDLTSDKARRGAERLAAALTLGKTWTIRAPGHDTDLGLAVGAIEPAAVLPTWTDAERNALLRRGLFAPATYGRLRFHHRGTQEYLTAKWLHRLLQEGCPRKAAWEILFAERYGVETLVPSLHAVAAWLGLDHPDIRDETLRREPAVLMRHGDPRSLPLATRELLLLTYAKRHAAGEVSDGRFDYRGLGILASPELAQSVRRSWSANSRDEFRIELLVLIREGVVKACADLARSAALDETVCDSVRTLAIQALGACGDSEALAAAARWLMADPNRGRPRLGPGFSQVLFPRYLSVDDLLAVIEHAPEDADDELHGFGEALERLWQACPDTNTRERLLGGLADLALAPPLRAPHTRISARHHRLGSHLEPLVRDAALQVGYRSASGGLIRALMAVERADGLVADAHDGPPLHALVSGNAALQRGLFWADVAEARQNCDHGRRGVTHWWQARFHPRTLWHLGANDLPWLFEDLAIRPLDADRQVALSGILSALSESGQLEAEAARLQVLVSGQAELERQLAASLAPPTETEEARRLRVERTRRQDERDAKEEANRLATDAAWRRFRDALEAEPLTLRDPDLLTKQRGGWDRLYGLSHWLSQRTGEYVLQAAQNWRLLSEGFGLPVAEAYRDGMKVLWRITPARRPKHKDRNTVETTWTAILSLAGLGIEAAEGPGWALHLSSSEAERAALHACLSEQGYPAWFDALAARHPAEALPVLREELRREWSGADAGRAALFSHFAHVALPGEAAVRNVLFSVIVGREPEGEEMFVRALRILPRLDLTEPQGRRLASVARRRLGAARAAGSDVRSRHCLSLLFLVDPDQAACGLAEWLEAATPEAADARAEGALGQLFERGSAVLPRLDIASVASVAVLVRLAYRYVRRENDRPHRRAFTPNARDRAEEARGALLEVLLRRPGIEAYRALRELATENVCRVSALRLRELARGRAEADAEFPAWTPAEVVRFEESRATPVKTGEALLDAVVGLLSEIQSSSHGADASSVPLLCHLKQEEDVQQWLTEQLSQRSQGRFHAHREVHIADGDKPDIVVSSAAAQVEVAIEVKHGGKKWTVRALESALRQQLAERYLKPETRRWGVLVVTHHRRRSWRDPETRETLDFRSLVERLDALAKALVRNRYGLIAVRVLGIDSCSDE